jgi:hypothetical protein
MIIKNQKELKINNENEKTQESDEKKIINLIKKLEKEEETILTKIKEKNKKFKELIFENIQESLLLNIKILLTNLEELNQWTEIPEKMVYLNQFNSDMDVSSPSEYIVHISEYLVTLPQQLEVIENFDNLEFDLKNGSYWLDLVCKKSFDLFMDKIFLIQKFSDFGFFFIFNRKEYYN